MTPRQPMKSSAIFSFSLVFILTIFFVPVLHAETQLTFGVYTSDKPSTMVRIFRPLLNILEKKMALELGEKVKIKMRVAKSYDEGIQDAVSGRVDFSRMGPASYVEVKKQNPGVSILAMESKNGKKHFKGVICIRKDSAIKDISDLKGKRFAFGNQRSTIGRYLSQQYLVENGINASNLASFDYLGRHDRVGEVVDQGKYHAGALKEGTFKKLVKKGRKLKVLATFLNVTKPWIASNELAPKLRNALTNVLLALDDPAALKSLKKSGFVEGSDEDFVAIRDSITNNKVFFN